MEVLEDENSTLSNENIMLKQTLQNYSKQLDKLKESIDELLCSDCMTKFQCKIKLHSAKQEREIIQQLNRPVDQKYQGNFKEPCPRKKRSSAITILKSKNIPMNLFTIFLSVAVVVMFLCICYLSKTNFNGNLYQNAAKNISNPRRNLNASFDNCEINDSMQKIENNTESIKEINKNPEDFVKFLKHHRYNFFTKVEEDYLEDPENETLQIFKTETGLDYNKSYLSIQQKLISENSTNKRNVMIRDDFIDTKNEKYKNIESLFCESSTMFSEDLKFAYDDEINFLHIMLKLKGIEVVNSNIESKRSNSEWSNGERFNNDLIQIGCKVIPSSVQFTSENDYMFDDSTNL